MTLVAIGVKCTAARARQAEVVLHSLLKRER